MGTSPIVDLERIGRLAAALDESARACARLAPAWSADLFWLLGFVQGQVAATLAPPVPAPPAAPVPPAPSAPARALPKYSGARDAEYRAAAQAWTMRRVAAWPEGQPPPSIAADIEAAKIAAAKGEIPHIPERFIRAARWPGWRRPPGRPKSGGK